MKKKTIVKIMSIALMVAMIAFCLHNVAFATDGINWTPDGNSGTDGGAGDSIKDIINAILRVAQIIGVGVAVIMLVVLAIKYISAAPSEKAEIKKHAIIYVVGAVVLFAASAIMGIIRNFALNIKATKS